MSNKRPGRDWSEWQKQQRGEERIVNKWKAPNLENRIEQDETTASMVLPRGFQKGNLDDRKLLKWIVIFLIGLLVRKAYFEYTKSDRVKYTPSNISRIKK